MKANEPPVTGFFSQGLPVSPTAQRRDCLPNRFGAIRRRRGRYAGIRGNDRDDLRAAGRIFRLTAANDLIDRLFDQPRKVHPARIGNPCLDHVHTVGGDDLTEFRNRSCGPFLRSGDRRSIYHGSALSRACSQVLGQILNCHIGGNNDAVGHHDLHVPGTV